MDFKGFDPQERWRNKSARPSAEDRRACGRRSLSCSLLAVKHAFLCARTHPTTEQAHVPSSTRTQPRPWCCPQEAAGRSWKEKARIRAWSVGRPQEACSPQTCKGPSLPGCRWAALWGGGWLGALAASCVPALRGPGRPCGFVLVVYVLLCPGARAGASRTFCSWALPKSRQ